MHGCLMTLHAVSWYIVPLRLPMSFHPWPCGVAATSHRSNLGLSATHRTVPTARSTATLDQLSRETVVSTAALSSPVDL